MDVLYAIVFIVSIIGGGIALAVGLGRTAADGTSDTIGDQHSYNLDHISRDGGTHG